MPALRPLIASSLLLAALSGCGGKKADEPMTPNAPDASTAPSSSAAPAAPAPTPPAAATPAPTAGATGALAGYIAGLDAIAMALESVKDETSAHEAAAIITAVASRMQGLATEVDKMPGTGREKAIAAARQELSHVQERIATAMQALGAKPALLKPVGDALNAMPKLQ